MTKLFLVAALVLVGCNTNTTPTNSKACPATISISGNSYTTTSCELKVGATVTIQANNGHPLSGSGANRIITSATTNQEFALTELALLTFLATFTGQRG